MVDHTATGSVVLLYSELLKKCLTRSITVDDFGYAHGITEDLVQIDSTGVYWQHSS